MREIVNSCGPRGCLGTLKLGTGAGAGIEYTHVNCVPNSYMSFNFFEYPQTYPHNLMYNRN